MSENRSPKELVLALVRVINGEAPRRAAADILDPDVEILMDRSAHRGIRIWYKWIYLIRNCGRIANLRMTRCEAQADPDNPQLVRLEAFWEGTVRSRHENEIARYNTRLSYLIGEGRIKKIWTHKSNYQFIFGRWVSNSVCYRLLLGWAVFHFSALSIKGKDFLVDADR